MRCGGEAAYWKLNQSAEVHQSFTMFESRAVRHGLLFQREIFFFKKGQIWAPQQQHDSDGWRVPVT